MLRTKEEILKVLGVGGDYNPHGGIPPDTKDVTLIELLIDLRDILKDARQDPGSFCDQVITKPENVRKGM